MPNKTPYRSVEEVSRAIALVEYRQAYEATAAAHKVLREAEAKEELMEERCRRLGIGAQEMQAFLMAE